MIEAQKYGQALPDQVDRVAIVFDAHLELIGDVRELYQSRAALERDYAAKLQLLAKKAAEKKAKMESTLVLGDEPTKSWEARTLKQNSLNKAYDEIIESMAKAAKDHVDIADVVTSQVTDVLKALERRNEDAKKKEMQFFQRILADRDRVYTERLKSKSKYDEDCIEVESFRQKQSRATDDKHADRVAKQAEQQRNEMLNSKNVYLISTAVANNAKFKFYNEDLPSLQDEFQTLQSRLVERFIRIILHAQDLQQSHLDSLKAGVAAVQAKLTAVNPPGDQNLFVEYNHRPFTSPLDWKFDPCTTHYDTDEMSTEDTPKIFLQNKLGKCRVKLQELGPFLDSKRKEIIQLSKPVTMYTVDHTLGTIDQASDEYLDAQHQLVFYTTSENYLKAEINAIISAIGDDQGGEHPHSFKSSIFSIPTQCAYCRSSIWGLTKQGKSCRNCGISVHSKCELKVPADCRHGGRPSSEMSRSSTVTSHSSTASAEVTSSTASSASFVQTGPHQDSYLALVLFDFTPTSEFELSVSEGEQVHVLESDDGSGWVKVEDSNGRSGLVPASYLDTERSRSPGTSTSQNQERTGRYVRAIFSYEPQGSDELELQEGEIMELSSGPMGGENYGNGWWEGFNPQGRKGIFPSNYVESV